jgi:hypothetical protein
VAVTFEGAEIGKSAVLGDRCQGFLICGSKKLKGVDHAPIGVPFSEGNSDLFAKILAEIVFFLSGDCCGLPRVRTITWMLIQVGRDSSQGLVVAECRGIKMKVVESRPQ